MLAIPVTPGRLHVGLPTEFLALDALATGGPALIGNVDVSRCRSPFCSYTPPTFPEQCTNPFEHLLLRFFPQLLSATLFPVLFAEPPLSKSPTRQVDRSQFLTLITPTDSSNIGLSINNRQREK